MFLMASGDIGRRIKHARETYRGVRLAQNELADKVGIKQSRLSNWETGRSDPDIEHLNLIGEVLGVDSYYLLTGTTRSPESSTQAAREETKNYKAVASSNGKIKKIGYIGAGTASGSIQLPDDQVQSVPAEFVSPENSALVVDGWSMVPYIHPGDVLIFRDQTQGVINKINAVVPPDESGPIAKKLVRTEDGKYGLASFNPEFPTITARDATFHGVLIGIVGSAVIIGPIASGISEIEIEAELSARLPIGYLSRHRD